MPGSRARGPNPSPEFDSSRIADELDTRLHELEKDIAVASQFIKLADRNYSEIKRKWSLLKVDIQGRTQAQKDSEQPLSPARKPRPKRAISFKPKNPTLFQHDIAEETAIHLLTKIDSGLHRQKVAAPRTRHHFGTNDLSESQLRVLKPRPKG